MIKNNEYIFSNSFLHGGNLFLYQYLIIDDKNITHIRETFIFGITHKETTIPKKYIRKIDIEKTILGCNILIYYCYPFQNYDSIIFVKGMKTSFGYEIKNLLI